MNLLRRHLAASAMLVITGCSRSSASPPAARTRTHAPLPAKDEASEVALNVCYQNAALLGEDTIGLAQTVSLLRDSMVANGMTPVRIGVGRCEDEQFVGCFGRPGVVACRADDVAQLALTAELTAQLARAQAGALLSLKRTGSIGPSDALASTARRLIQGEGAGTSRIAWIAGELGSDRETIDKIVGESMNFLRRADVPMTTIGQEATRLVLTFIIGHELSHVNGNKCPETRHARSEDDAFFKFVADVSSSNQLFCEAAPLSAELVGDLCGTRALRYTPTSLKGPDLSIAATIAADTLSWALITQHAEHLITDERENLTRTLPGYLHPLLRVLLVTNEMKQITASSTPGAVCGRTARNVVIGLQKETQVCPDTRQEIDDMIMARLPSQVQAALEGSTGWTDATFWCGSPPR